MSRHLLIAGTGRAGTSFLVRYLTALGLDTHLSRAGPAAEWDENANAGLEDLPLTGKSDLPYVLKSPWIYQMIHQALAEGAVALDAAIIPMRDLTEAASSRSIIEMQAMHRKHPWMAGLDATWEHYGETPGGIVFSTSPIDQARLLAVGFHQLLEALVKADVPVVLLAFPRFVDDADYLFDKLAAVLPGAVTRDDARAAHASVADPGKVRVGAEVGFSLEGPGAWRLERAALGRALAEVRAELAAAQDELARVRSLRDGNAVGRRRAEVALAAVTRERDALRRALLAAVGVIAGLRSVIPRARIVRLLRVQTAGRAPARAAMASKSAGTG